jgi:hypothetical protein
VCTYSGRILPCSGLLAFVVYLMALRSVGTMKDENIVLQECIFPKRQLAWDMELEDLSLS